MMLAKPRVYTTVRLNLQSDRSWAVVNRETGAIVLDVTGSLMMRLARHEAERIAADLEQAEDAGAPAPR